MGLLGQPCRQRSRSTALNKIGQYTSSHFLHDTPIGASETVDNNHGKASDPKRASRTCLGGGFAAVSTGHVVWTRCPAHTTPELRGNYARLSFEPIPAGLSKPFSTAVCKAFKLLA